MDVDVDVKAASEVFTTLFTTLQEQAISRLTAAEAKLRSELAELSASDATKGRSQYHIHGFNVSFVLNKPGDSVSDQFNFHGPTTFINRPVNTVVSDFQNTYGAVSGSKDLAQLLRLVLSSSYLSDAEKDEAAGLVHEAARDVGESSPQAGRSKLEALKAVLVRAADIATPALEIASKVIGILN